MIELDGSQGEGGGQILRSSLTLSVVTGQPFVLERIRARRPKPGLMRQHLTCVQAAARIAGADTEGAEPGATRLRFHPGRVRAGDYTFQVGSAGSCMLVLQTVLWPLLLADGPSTLRLTGGTHNPMAPCVTFLQRVLPVVLAQTGGTVALEVRRHGFYPAGGGEVLVQITPAPGGLRALRLMERGAPVAHFAECLHAGLQGHVATRELETLGQLLGWGAPQTHPELLRNRGLRVNEGPGNALLVTLAFEHMTEVFAGYGERGVSAEQVARQLVREVRAYQSGSAPVGPHLADQLMLPLALAAGPGGEYRTTALTEHSRTNAQVIGRFLPLRFELAPHPAGGFRVSVQR
jgi:RNA 3'-terminal phosphate cyclase (ATP)